MIPAWILALVFLIAAYLFWQKRQYEHAFTRLLGFGFYLWMTIDPTPNTEIARTLSRFFWGLLAITDILSHIFRKYFWGR